NGSALSASWNRLVGRLSSVVLTVVTALFCVLLVFAWLLLSTSGWSGDEIRIRTWTQGGSRVQDTGEGVFFPAGSQPSGIFAPFPEGKYSRLSFDLYIKKPVPPNEALLLYSPVPHPENLTRAVNIRSGIQKTGWNDSVEIGIDEERDLFDSALLGIAMSVPQGENTFGVRNVKVWSVGPCRRAAEMLDRMFQWQPLIQGSNNFVYSQKVAGRGVLFIFWAAMIPAVLVLMIRRYVLRESFNVIGHGLILVLVLFSLADFRNMTDYLRDAKAAVGLKAKAEDFPGMVGLHEDEYFPWVEDALRSLEKHLPERGVYYFQVDESPTGAYQAYKRAQYYALPAESTRELDKATLAILVNSRDGRIQETPEWRQVEAFPSGTRVYEKVESR
ncbi:hypothetical protein HQ520_02415, partial [bacterium]|nr:hypothetical protein [bacterium]